jgi:hypothetical protein
MNLSCRLLIFGFGVLWITVASCDRTSLERTFSADPKASQWNTPATPVPKLPADFPEAARYPNAVLKTVSPTATAPIASGKTAPQAYQTQWSTSDSPEQILNFYQDYLQLTPWQGFQKEMGDGVVVVSAQQQTQRLSVSVPAPATSATSSASALKKTAQVEFSMIYEGGLATASSSKATPTDRRLTSNLFSDLNAVPLSLQPYVKDVVALAVLPSQGGASNQPISRALFTRWLVEVNNRLYRDRRPVRQIRLATASKPAFIDVPATHPDFPYIQGLAEAGYLPSSLSGDSTQTRFQPTLPLTRETLLLWKVPIDRQQILPTVSAQRVKQLWGFKDVNRITPIALSAVAADYQNGDLSNLRRLLGSTLLFQPQKPVTYAEAAAALWFIGVEGDSLSVKDLLRSEQQTAATETVAPSPKVKQNNSP